MSAIRVGDSDLAYVEVGDGVPCVMLHGGLGLDHTYLRPAFDRLGQRFRVVYYDMRGNGRSDRPPLEELTMDVWADDVVHVADALEIDRFVAVGHSYGGFVGQELAIRHPDRLLALVLLNTTPGQLGSHDDPDSHQGDPPSPEQLAIMQEPVTSDEEMARMMQRLLPFYFHRTDPAVLAAGMAETIYSHATMIRSSELLSEWSSIDRLDSVRCPTLVLAGRHDTFTSAPQASRIARRIPDVECHVFEESGHFPWIEEEAGFWDVVESWLERRVLAAGSATIGP